MLHCLISTRPRKQVTLLLVVTVHVMLCYLKMKLENCEESRTMASVHALFRFSTYLVTTSHKLFIIIIIISHKLPNCYNVILMESFEND